MTKDIGLPMLMGALRVTARNSWPVAFAVSLTIAVSLLSESAGANEPAKVAAAEATPKVRSVTPSDLKAIKTLNERYRTSKSITANVEKNLKLGLLGQERKASGKVYIGQGKFRMELEGAEKTLLIVNKKNIWAVTLPDESFKDAAAQVIKGDMTSKKAKSQAMIGLLTQGRFLEFFKPTGLNQLANGEKVYFLHPEKDQTDIKRAQITVSKDGKQINEIRYWDERDNETSYVFSSVAFGKKLDEKLFNYTPPANADVMTL